MSKRKQKSSLSVRSSQPEPECEQKRRSIWRTLFQQSRRLPVVQLAS
ncbi:uncharacterized protein M6B38_259435 [Iris pallida]|uniref:Uncharacterized protein n=1 Tax=Iris pallida TaxID=29817 RepID=A0AAX6IE72_IRIPA|nr:uncharacterized protein M6B38_259435 [Iris pallida]